MLEKAREKEYAAQQETELASKTLEDRRLKGDRNYDSGTNRPEKGNGVHQDLEMEGPPGRIAQAQKAMQEVQAQLMQAAARAGRK